MSAEERKRKRSQMISTSDQMQRMLDSLRPAWVSSNLNTSTDQIVQFQNMFQSLLPKDSISPIIASIEPSQGLIAMLDSLHQPQEVSDAISNIEKSMQYAVDLGLTEELIHSITRSIQPMPEGLVNLIEVSANASSIFTSLPDNQIHLAAIAQVLEQQQRFVGIIDYSEPEEPDETDQDDSHYPLSIPEEASRRLIEVDYFPVEVIRKLQSDPKQLYGLSPREFEKMTAELLADMGFSSIVLTPYSGDGGRDIVATRHVNGVPVIMAFECKRYAEDNKIGPSILRALLGTISTGETRANVGVLVTTSTFTSGSTNLILSEVMLDGKDFNSICTWLDDYNT